ncbi:MAG: hypothetical protein JW827_05690, partial [Spirochaetes bacterium]|nr:hypothetical protein [Spirochaetota bacterium]
VKVATAGSGSSANNYDGPIYIDDFIWYDTPAPGDNHGFEIEPIAWYSGGGDCLSVERSADRATNGSYSLKMNYNLQYPGEGFTQWDVGNTNLSGKTINVYFYAPAAGAGNCTRPNGVSIFAKDTSDRWANGHFNKIVDYVGTCIHHEDSWWQITWNIDTDTGGGCYKQSGFDSSHIKQVGIKISTPGNGTSAVNDYNGPYYIDDFTW